MSKQENPGLTAEADQAGASLATYAQVQGEYFRALLGQGFYREEALELVRDYFSGAADEDDG